MENNRVVITGMGVIAPNGHGLTEYEASLRQGKSGIRFHPKLEQLKFACQVGGIPQNVEQIKAKYFSQQDLLAMSESMIYAGIAGMDCWQDAGLNSKTADGDPDWDTGPLLEPALAAWM